MLLFYFEVNTISRVSRKTTTTMKGAQNELRQVERPFGHTGRHRRDHRGIHRHHDRARHTPQDLRSQGHHPSA